MHLDGTLLLTAAQATSAGRKPANEDCMGVRIPDDALLTTKAAAAVIADGVSTAEAGREASETCVQSFLADYFSTPESWTVKTSAQAVLTALNRWLYGQGQRFLYAEKGYVSTLSALVLKSRTAHLFHVGDTWIYRLRGGTLEQLTRDHATKVSDERCYLTRAMGLDLSLEIDYRTVDLARGDLFFLSTDSVHDYVPSDVLAQELRALCDPADADACAAACHRILEHAADAKSPDNLTCQVLRVDGLPGEDRDDLYRRLSALPFPPPLAPGMTLDGLRIEREIHASARSQLYEVTRVTSGERMVMKTPSVNFDDDVAYIERFVMEPWIGRRIDSPHVARTLENDRPATCLYYLMQLVEGDTLADWMRAHPRPEISVALDIVDQLARGLMALHRREMFHQDLKPDNAVIDASRHVTILDFGSCYIAGIHEIAAPIERDLARGTAGYSAPECRLGRRSTVRSDLYSLATIAYERLTGHLPFGDAIERARTWNDFLALRYEPSDAYNPMIPPWLDAALAKALAPDPADRYEELSELLYDLRHPNPRLAQRTYVPLTQRDPVKLWRTLAIVLLLTELGTLWLWAWWARGG
jgi:serine/threonine protein phosphatase PrpC